MKKELRCKECGRLLMKIEKVVGYFQIKCRCGTYNSIYFVNRNTDYKKLNKTVNRLIKKIEDFKIQSCGGI